MDDGPHDDACYILETIGETGTEQQIAVFETDDPLDVESKTVAALSDLANDIFKDGARSVTAAVREPDGRFVFTARLSLKTSWLIDQTACP